MQGDEFGNAHGADLCLSLLTWCACWVTWGGAAGSPPKGTLGCLGGNLIMQFLVCQHNVFQHVVCKMGLQLVALQTRMETDEWALS